MWCSQLLAHQQNKWYRLKQVTQQKIKDYEQSNFCIWIKNNILKRFKTTNLAKQFYLSIYLKIENNTTENSENYITKLNIFNIKEHLNYISQTFLSCKFLKPFIINKCE